MKKKLRKAFLMSKVQKQPPEVFYKKKVFLKISQTATLLKKRLWHLYFPVNIIKFLRTPLLLNTSTRLLLKVIFWKCIQYTIHWDGTQMLKKFPSDKMNVTKNALFYNLQLNTVLPLICDSHMNWSTQSASLKACVGFSIFDCITILLKLYFCWTKNHGLFDFKTS